MAAMRSQLLFRAVATILPALVFCASLVGSDSAFAQVVLQRGNTADPGTIDPQRANGQWENHIISDMFVGLSTYDVKGNSIYGAAESHTVSPDGLVWTFKIRKDHKWSDGAPVTADDFVYAYRRINDPATKAEYAAITYMIKNAQAANSGAMPGEAIGARAIDAETLEITLEHPTPYFFQALSHYCFYPVPKHVVEKYGDRWTDKDKMVSNGAYMLVDRVDNDYVHVKKNPYFYDAADVQIDEVYYKPVAGAAAVKRFRAAELDINNDFPLPELETLKRTLPEETKVSPFILTQYVAFNMTHPPFDNKDVRLALGMAIDRETVTDKVLKGGQVPAYGLVPPGISGYPGDAFVPYKDVPIEERRQKARDLLASAGFGPDNPLKATYIFQSTSVEAKLVAVTLQDMWRRVGAEIQLQSAESKVHYANLRRQNYDIGWGGWIADFNDARNYLFLAETSAEDMNYTKYSNPNFDQLLVESDMTVDAAKRQQIMKEAEQMMLNDSPMAPVYFGTSRNLVHSWVKGWEPNPVDVHRTRWMRIEGSRQAVAMNDDAAPGAIPDGAEVQTGEEQSWSSWFSGVTCSWFGIWCAAT